MGSIYCSTDGSVFASAEGRVGVISRGDLFNPPEAEIAYALAKQWRGRGYITEAGRAIVKYALEQMKLPRVFAGVSTENLPSQKVAKRIGLIYEDTIEWYGLSHRMYWLRNTPEKTEVLKYIDT